MRPLIEFATRARRFTLRHRRGLAAAFAALAVLAGIHAVTADTETTPVVVATTNVPAGTVLESSMLTVRAYPTHLAPDDSLSDTATAVGQPVGASMNTGEPLTQNRLLTPHSATEPGSVLTPVRIDDPTQVAGIEAGDRVTLVATDPLEGDAEILASEAVVEAVTEPGEPGRSPVVLHVAVDEATALRIVAVSGRSPVTVMVHGR